VTTQNALWRRSSHSGDANNCVEVALSREAVAVRDSKNPQNPPLLLGGDVWADLLGGLKRH